MNDESRLSPAHRQTHPPQTIAPSTTPLQMNLLHLYRVLGNARKLDEHERQAFASIGGRAFTHAFAGELVLTECENMLRAA